MAQHRYRQKKFGAEIVGVLGDVIGCIVKNPRRDKETAIKLAWQQHWYCRTDYLVHSCPRGHGLNLTISGRHAFNTTCVTTISRESH
ncbi:DUF4253 domain-containing protein [Undibacterium flavidum]|uniref:DUF4253 domain-containing protein n=1 Tax=Undibacterium flavidum TaxID=2762297 RepID=UPI0038B53D2D